VPRTSTWALANVTVAYALAIANHGLPAAARADASLRLGINTYAGNVTYEPVAHAHGLPYARIEDVLG
jgi:alanine dehydrogenase